MWRGGARGPVGPEESPVPSSISQPGSAAPPKRGSPAWLDKVAGTLPTYRSFLHYRLVGHHLHHGYRDEAFDQTSHLDRRDRGHTRPSWCSGGAPALPCGELGSAPSGSIGCHRRP